MHKFPTKSILVLLVFALIAGGSPAFSKNILEKSPENDPGPMVFDLVIIRPFGIVATVMGSAFFVVSLPFSVVGGNSEEAFEKMVLDPARYTFQRRLGDF